MSESYSIFINKKVPILKIKASLEKIINSTLVKDNDLEWDVFRAIVLGLEISLIEAIDFDDDEDNKNEIKLAEYNYYINVDYIPRAFDEGFTDDWRKLTSQIIGNMVSKELSCKCIVIKNMQILIEEFIPEPDIS